MSTRFRKIAVILASVAFGGCLPPTGPVQPTAPLISTAVEVRPDAIVTGGLVDVTLSVTNHDRKPVTLEFGSTCQILFVVRDLGGNQVSSDWACGAALTTLTLAAGETKRQASVWRAARFDGQQHVPLPPGLYRVHAYVSQHGYASPPSVVELLE